MVEVVERPPFNDRVEVVEVAGLAVKGFVVLVKPLPLSFKEPVLDKPLDPVEPERLGDLIRDGRLGLLPNLREGLLRDLDGLLRRMEEEEENERPPPELNPPLAKASTEARRNKIPTSTKNLRMFKLLLFAFPMQTFF